MSDLPPPMPVDTVSGPDAPARPVARTASLPASVGTVRQVHRVSVVVLLVGLLVTATLSFVASSVRDSNERRLLRQRVHEVATVATASLPTVEVPLSSAAILAERTNADRATFSSLMTPLVSGRPFVSASIWRVRATDPRPLTVIGAPPKLAGDAPSDIQRLFAHAAGRPTLSVADLLEGPDRRLGYASTVPGPNATFVVYVESALPKDRRATIAKNSAFADLDYALFLGATPTTDRLLASSSGGAVLHGRRASSTVPFGDTKLLIVIAPRKELGGSLLARLPWMLAVLGVVLALSAALLVERLLRQRERAQNLAGQLEEVAEENARLYATEREIAKTLQHSLLPDQLSGMPGVETAARYEPGVEGTDVGGDWYDIVPVGPSRLLISVGDVCGRGLRAAAAMASLRFAIRAYAAEGDTPDAILHKLGSLMESDRDVEFATVICGILDLDRHEITVARAGHPDFLLVEPSGARFLDVPGGSPIGADPPASYRATTVALPDEGTLLGYTDGLVERRGESLDVGLAKLRASASTPGEPVTALVARVVDELTPTGLDDVALLAVRWTTSNARLAS